MTNVNVTYRSLGLWHGIMVRGRRKKERKEVIMACLFFTRYNFAAHGFLRLHAHSRRSLFLSRSSIYLAELHSIKMLQLYHKYIYNIYNTDDDIIIRRIKWKTGVWGRGWEKNFLTDQRVMRSKCCGYENRENHKRKFFESIFLWIPSQRTLWNERKNFHYEQRKEEGERKIECSKRIYKKI